ncbi:MAG: rhomboid family intramembrane serine protease [Myxococcales bacterium]|nr:rhomboid family intramembrane serine protease [Myxococcales bacterium]
MPSSEPSSSRALFALTAMLWLGLFVAGVWLDGQASFPLWQLSVSTLTHLGALLVPLSFPSDGWRLATAWLLHIDALHLMTNLAWLSLLTWLWPNRCATLIPLGLGVLASGAATILLAPSHALLSAGGSGVLLTLFAMLSTGHVTMRTRTLSLVACALILSSGLWLPVDSAAHAGGLGAGLAWGLLQRRNRLTV